VDFEEGGSREVAKPIFVTQLKMENACTFLEGNGMHSRVSPYFEKTSKLTSKSYLTVSEFGALS
jgi:hypothetical protein